MFSLAFWLMLYRVFQIPQRQIPAGVTKTEVKWINPKN